jgi:TonB family protein
MSYGGRLGICAVASIASHLLLARGSAHLPARVEAAPPAIVHVALRETAPEPEPEPEKAAVAKQPIPRDVPMRRARTAVESAPRAATKNVTPTERPDESKNASDTPVFGLSMESTSAAGGPAFRVGNTLQTKPKDHDDAAQAGAGHGLLTPVPAYEVTKLPVPKGGQCPSGPYTDEAREAGLEGTVILTFVVDESGRVRDIKVLQGLGMGLSEAAKRAIAACPFVPGERNGQRVPTRVPAYKVRFTLRENE